jgi:beta-phosphoglucomutase-like phosphatase (HAD superfamily)
VSGAAARHEPAITRDRTVELINQLRDQGFKVAVVTSSQNCTDVLKATNWDHCFDVQLDCNVIHAEHLAGKPALDIYLMVANDKDAVAGMEAGLAGTSDL